MKKENKGVHIVVVIISSILILIALLVVWFRIPYSGIKSQFTKDYEILVTNNLLHKDILKEEDIKSLPKIIQLYIKNCGYIKSPKFSFIKSFYKDVSFVQGIEGKKLNIDYTKYNFARQPQSIALIESSMFGIPFQGYDSFIDGEGSMKGVFAKAIPVFHQTGSVMDKAALVTFLSECLLIPSVATMDYIQWEEIDEYNVKATISCYDISASGIFTFNQNGEMIRFTTNDRAITNSDGTMEYVPWSVECNNYKLNMNGYKIPTSLKAIWNYEDGDFIYFDSNNLEITYYE